MYPCSKIAAAAVFSLPFLSLSKTIPYKRRKQLYQVINYNIEFKENYLVGSTALKNLSLLFPDLFVVSYIISDTTKLKFSGNDEIANVLGEFGGDLRATFFWVLVLFCCFFPKISLGGEGSSLTCIRNHQVALWMFGIIGVVWDNLNNKSLSQHLS